MDEKVSIIVPVYNGERFVKSCVECLLAQTYESIEIIIINDGSTDRTKSILENLDHPQLVVVHQENKGVSEARNKGLALATGKYICFIDCDDQVSPIYCETLVQGMKKNGLAIGGYEVVKKNKKKQFLPTKEVQPIEKALISSLNYQQVNTALWNKMFLLKLIKKNSLQFDSKITIGEDLLFLFTYAKFVETTALFSEILYVYYENENGAMMSRGGNFKDTWLSEWAAVQEAEKLCEEKQWKECLQVIKYKKIRIAEKLLFLLYKYKKTKEPEYQQLKYFLRKNIRSIVFMKDLAYKRRFRIILNTIHPSLYSFIKKESNDE